MRKLRHVIVSLVGVALLVVSFGSLGVIAQETGPVTIGALISVTGVNSFAGSQEQAGLEMALEEINEFGVLGGRLLKLIIEDTESRPEAAMDAVHKLIDVNRVPIIVGADTSATTIPTGTYSNSQGVIQINMGATSPQIREIGPYFFTIVPTSEVIGRTMVELAIKDSGQKNFAIMVINDAYGVGVGNVMRKTVEEAGGEVLVEVRYEANKADYRAELQRLFASNPPAILSVAWADASRIIHKQAYEMGLYQTVEGSWYSPFFLDSIGKCIPETIENRKGLDLAFTGTRAEQFTERFKEKYGEDAELTHYAPLAYDSVWVTALAINMAGSTNPEEIMKVLPTVFNIYRGASNPDKSVDEDGIQIYMGWVSRIYKDGEAEIYEIAN